MAKPLTTGMRTRAKLTTVKTMIRTCPILQEFVITFTDRWTYDSENNNNQMKFKSAENYITFDQCSKHMFTILQNCRMAENSYLLQRFPIFC